MTRLDELHKVGTDYSLPINAFANHAKRLFNRMAWDNNLKTRIESAEYGDGAARLYVKEGYDSLERIGFFYSEVVHDIRLLAEENKKLIKLELPITDIILGWGEIQIRF